MRVTYILSLALATVYAVPQDFGPELLNVTPATGEPLPTPVADEPVSEPAADEPVSKPAADEAQFSLAANGAVSEPAADDAVPNPASTGADEAVSKPSSQDPDGAITIIPLNSRRRKRDARSVRVRRGKLIGKDRTHTTEMTTDAIKQWKVTLNHVTQSCRKEVAQAFVAADIAFPGVSRPFIYKASGTCNDEIFEAFRKYFDYGKPTRRAVEHNTVEMDNPDLTFFVELFGESGGLLRKISSDDKGALSDVEWKESIFQILHKATNHIPTECREETGLIFDVALGESLDIGFTDGKKNFKITQKCSKLTNKALETFFRKLRELEVAVEIEEDLVDKSKLLSLIDEWKNSKAAPLESSKEDTNSIISPEPLPPTFAPVVSEPPLVDPLLEQSPEANQHTLQNPESPEDVDTYQENPSTLFPPEFENSENTYLAPIAVRKLEEPDNVPHIQLNKLEQFPVAPAVRRIEQRLFRLEHNADIQNRNFWPHFQYGAGGLDDGRD